MNPYHALLRASDPLDTSPPPPDWWKRWRALADFERLAPLLWRKLLADGGMPPNTAADELRELTTRAIIEQRMGHHWLKRFSERLTSTGKQVMLLKGAAFNGWLYEENAPRRSVDIDLLARAEDFDAIERLLLETHDVVLIDPRRRLTHRDLFERMYRPRCEPGIIVELHRDLTNPGLYRIDHAALWRASQAHPTYPADQMRMPSREHALLNLAIHAARNRCFDDYGLLDAWRLICLAEPDWRLLETQATKWGARAPLYLLLRAVGQCWPQARLDDVIRRLRPSAARRYLLKNLLTTTPRDGRLHQLAAQLALSDRLRGVLRFQLAYLLTRAGDALTAIAPFRQDAAGRDAHDIDSSNPDDGRR